MNEELDVAPEATVIVDGENFLMWFALNGKTPNQAKAVLKKVTGQHLWSPQSAIYLPARWHWRKTHRHPMSRYARAISFLLQPIWVKDGDQSVDRAIIRDLRTIETETLFMFSGDHGFEPRLSSLRKKGVNVVVVSASHVLSSEYYKKDHKIILLNNLLSVPTA